MGRMGAEAMAEMDISLEQKLSWHLQSNHYPPVPSSMVAPCIEAIDKANEGRWDAQVALPDGVEYKGRLTAPVSAMVEQHHLDSFLDQEEWD